MIGEFDLINRFFAPLAGEAGLGLTDDAAFYTPPMGQDLIISKDMLVADVHFFKGDAPRDIAEKALAVNLSDLAAKGAKPVGYMLGISLNDDINETWLEGFVEGLSDMQEAYSIALFGGDTVKGNGPLTISITVFGTVLGGTGVKRSTARAGDLLCVTGTIGDAALGLKQREGKLKVGHHHFLNCYLHPVPQQLLGQKLPQVASAAMDISDGLMADAAHMAKSSGVAITVHADKIPFSKETQDVLAEDKVFEWAVTGGDDYQLLIAVNPAKRATLQHLSDEVGITVTDIGTLTAGEGAELLDADGKSLHFNKTGFTHS